LQHRAARLGLLRLLPREIAADKLFCLGDEVLLVFVSAPLRFASLLALDEEGRIVAVVTDGLAVLHFDDAAARAVEKITVVRNDDVS
jgi:hypothetical protein